MEEGIRRKDQRDGSVRWSGLMFMAFIWNGAINQGLQATEKGSGMNSPPEPPEGMPTPCF